MKNILSWSTGKDAAYVLHLLSLKHQKPAMLLTTVNKDFNRVSMHGLRTKLLERQAEALQIPLYKIALPQNVNMKTYNEIMQKHLKKLQKKGFAGVIFGDIFLKDLKAYREQQLREVSLQAGFPLWGMDTQQLARQIIKSGIKAVVVSINAKRLDPDFAGRKYDMDFLNDLPENVDWCGENGEFHTFVYDSPLFTRPVDFVLGAKTFRSYKPCSQADNNTFKSTQNNSKQWDTGFWFIDMIPL